MANDRSEREEFRNLVASHFNVFGVGGTVDGDTVVLNLAAAPRMRKHEVANLVAWLVMVGNLERADVEPVLRSQGVPWPF